jgi:hypothetical protein
VFGGLNRLLPALVVGAALIALVAPSVAHAGCNGRPSAANVYSPCLPDGGGGKSSGGGGGGHAGPSSTPPANMSSRTANALKHAGPDKRVLAALVEGSGRHRLLQDSGPAEEASTPTALGSVFDLGSGPTALLIVLGGTAFVLLAASGVHGWRRRSPRP